MSLLVFNPNHLQFIFHSFQNANLIPYPLIYTLQQFPNALKIKTKNLNMAQNVCNF